MMSQGFFGHCIVQKPELPQNSNLSIFSVKSVKTHETGKFPKLKLLVLKYEVRSTYMDM